MTTVTATPPPEPNAAADEAPGRAAAEVTTTAPITGPGSTVMADAAVTDAPAEDLHPPVADASTDADRDTGTDTDTDAHTAFLEPETAPAAPTSPAGDAPAIAPAVDCGALLKKTFPALFAGGPKPIKLRIQVDIQERAPGVFGKQALSAFFRRYTGSTSYLIAVSRAKTRFDLDGAPAGDLSEEHRQLALDELARRRGNQESRVALEEQKRRNRATLLHDFERTTLTPANFCALKGIGVDELDGYLATARREAAERPQNPPAFNDRSSGHGQGDRRPPLPRPPLSRDRRPVDAGGPPPRRR